MFDKKRFLRDIKTITLIAVFIFLLACINLFSKTNDQILSTSSMEISGYVGIYNDKYDELNSTATTDLKTIASELENDEEAIYQKNIYILEKASGEIISTGDVSSKIQNELTSKVNEKMIIIDGKACKVVDFEHYKLLVQVNTLQEYEEFLGSVANYSLIAVFTLLVAFLLIALSQKIRFKQKTFHAYANIVITLLLVFTFAFEVLQTEMTQLETIASKEKTTLQQDLNALCNSAESKISSKEDIVAIANSIANASITLKEVIFTGDEQQFNGDISNANVDIAKNFEVTSDAGKTQSEKTNFYIQFALLLLLAFILAKEMADRANAQEKADAKGGTTLNANDRHVRTTMLLIGLATASFGIVNVLRIRQVVMINWTGDVAGIISAIFTATMVMTILGSFISSTLLKKCKNIKKYVMLVCGLGVLGSVACGISNNVAIFIAGLLFYNIAHTTTRMTDNFYISTISDTKRKDLCGVEFNASKTIGEVVGTIAGGIISVVVSFAFVQIVVGILFVITFLFMLKMNCPESISSKNEKGGIKETLITAATAIRYPNVTLFAVLVVMTGSVPYMLVQYKLPLDIAALGLSAVVLSFVKTLQEVVEIYSKPLYHVISKRVNAVTHAALYVIANGAVIFLYMLGGTSLLIIGVAVAALGILDGSGKYAITKAFRELPDLAKMPESDRIVALTLAQKTGDTVSPPLLSAFQNNIVVPVIVTVLPVIYLVKDKFARKK